MTTIVGPNEPMVQSSTAGWVGLTGDRQGDPLNRSCEGGPEEESRSFAELCVVVVLLSLMSLVGTSGNALVLCVFSNKREEKAVSTLLIIALAVVDFVTCLIVIPYTIYMESVDFRVRDDTTCKIYQFLITSNIPFSALIMVVIAIDRYLCICHPFLRAFTVSRVKVVVAALALFAAAMGLCVALMFGVYQRKEGPPCSSLPPGLTQTTSSWDLLTDQLERSKQEEETLDAEQIRALLENDTLINSGSSVDTSASSLEIKLFNNSVKISTFVSSAIPSVNQSSKPATTLLNLVTGGTWAIEGTVYTSVHPIQMDETERNSSEDEYLSSDSEEIVNVGHCSSNDLLISKDFQYYYQKLYTAMYPVCLGIVIVLYVLIYRSVLTRRSRRQMEKKKTMAVVETLTTSNHTDGRTSGGYQQVQQNETDNCTAGSSEQVMIVESGKKTAVRRPSKRRQGSQKHRMTKAESTRLANLKTAAMLFVVTVVFVVTFLPAFLMVLLIVPNNAIVFYLYFANNVANPVIYSFMNQNFRNDLLKLIGGRR